MAVSGDFTETMQRVHGYLQRIDYTGPLAPTLQTLRNLHRAHLLTVPFENLDVQLGVSPSLDIDRIVDKIVTQRRGGWCYEMNALFGWALRALGFDVDYIAAAVNRERAGAAADMNHLALIVHLDAPYLADVGFGNGFLTPLPLRPGMHSDTRFEFRLSREREWWRFTNHRYDGTTYDFTEEPRTLDQFSAKCAQSATSSESPFVQNLVCARLTDDGMVRLTNAQLQALTKTGSHEETAQTAAALAQILSERFGLRVADPERLWARVSAQHRAMLRKKIRGF